VLPNTGGESPADVLGRMEKAVASRNPQDYADCLADSFTFIPYLPVVSANPEVPWNSWDKAREAAFARWVCSPARTASFDLTSHVIERGLEVTRRAQWDVVYTLRYGGGTFRGRAILTFERIRANWYLSRWQDTSAENVDGHPAETSGDLRAIAARW